MASLVVDMEDATRAVIAGHRDGIHDLRVAIRRAGSCLRTFRLLLDHERVSELRRELKWMATMLATARDSEVLACRLEHDLDGLEVEERMGPVRRELVGGCRARADRGRAAVMEAFESERFRRILGALDTFAVDPPYVSGHSGTDTATLRRCVRKEVRRTRRRAGRAEAAAGGAERDAAFHEVRKAAKRVRYAAETVSPLEPKAARRMARRYESVQDLLGERQDAAVARRMLVSEGARVGVQPAHNGFTYGILAEHEREAIRAAERRWPAVWHRANRTKLCRFLMT